jgi:hypothetical protein
MADNESLISAPPPPPEVKVRTMQADLATMAKSGGGLPRFENVKVAGWTPERKRSAGIAGVFDRTRNRRNLTMLIVLAAIVVLVIIGYFIYASFSGGNSVNTAIPPATQSNNGSSGAVAQAPTTPSPSVPSQNAATSASAPTAPFTHVSLFTKPADQVLTLMLASGGAVQSATDLLTFNQKLTTVLAQAKKGAALIEINVVGADGKGVPVNDVLSQENAQVIDPQVLTAHFSPDATFFVYHDANGFWPGYVLALNPGENWLFLESDVAGLESSPSLANFFLTNVGAPAANGFTDSTVSSTPVRILSYPTANPAAAFVYGWSNARLILGTSRDGFAAALAHL